MINTVFHFVNDPTFNYAAAVANGDISEYTIVFNVADRSIRAKNTMFGRMSRADIVETLGDISDIIPAATSTKMGGIKIGYTSDVVNGSKTYAVKLDENNRAYVDVPWTDTVTPVFDDSELQEAINAQRQRIDNYISDLTDYVQDLTEALLVDAQWVTDNLAEGEIGRQLKDWTDLYMRQYGVWEWKDENDHSKGRWIKTSVLEQTADRIEARVGEVDSENKAAISDLELSVNGKYVVEMQLSGDTNTATNINTISLKIAKPSFIITNGMELNEKDFTNVPLQDRVYYKTTDSTTQYFKLVRVDGVVESNATLTAAYDEYTTNNDGNLDKLVKMAASQLQLKTSKNGNNIESVSDLASVVVDGRFTGYSGLNERVTSAEDTLSSEVSTLSSVVDGTNSDFLTNVLSGLVATSTINNNKISSISLLISAINDKNAGITVMVTKDSSNNIESSAKISADLIYLSGNTFANSIFANLVDTDALNAAVARIGTLEANEITIGDAAAAAQTTANNALTSANNAQATADNAQTTASNTNAEFIRLANGNGTFTGNVNAKTLIAGDPNGINIRTSSDKIEFCQGADTRAYFVANGQGMLLHVWDSNGVEHYIDFTNWATPGSTTYTTVNGYYKITSNGPIELSNIEKGSDGKYYIHSGSAYTPITDSLYTVQNVNATDSLINHGSGVPCIFAKYNNTSNGAAYAINLSVDRYIENVFQNGAITSTTNNYKYYCSRYPTNLQFNSDGTIANSSNSFGGRFIQPVYDNANFQFRYVYGSTERLNPTENYQYVGVASYTDSYTTSPTLYYAAVNSQM